MTDTREHPTDRAAKARKVRMRSAEEKKAAHLRERGWLCIPPEEQRSCGHPTSFEMKAER